MTTVHTIQIAPAMADIRVTGSRVTAKMKNGRRYIYELPEGQTFPLSVNDRFMIRRGLRDALMLCSYVDQAEQIMNDWLKVQGRLSIDRTKEVQP